MLWPGSHFSLKNKDWSQYFIGNMEESFFLTGVSI